MATTLSQKWLTIFCQKSSKFCIFRTMRFCSNFTSMWFKYLSNNVWRDFRLKNVSVSNGNLKFPIGKPIFAVNLSLKLSRTTVTNATTESLKSLHTLFDTFSDYILAKFEPNRIVWNVQKLNYWTKNQVLLKPFLTKRWSHFVRRFCGWYNYLIVNYGVDLIFFFIKRSVSIRVTIIFKNPGQKTWCNSGEICEKLL